MVVVTIAGMAATIIAMFVIPTWGSDYTNQYLVLTAHRTRDLQEPNVYSMNTVEGDDPTTRLFICMMHAEIGRADCPMQKSAFQYRACLIGKNKDCIAASDLNWPIDYGFQRCVVSTFNPPTKQVNIFTECMRHTDMIQGLAIETQNTMRFLGSYNFASLLIAASCALVSFLIFTSGGVYSGFALTTEEKHGYHITNWWALCPCTISLSLLSGWWFVCVRVISTCSRFRAMGARSTCRASRLILGLRGLVL